MPLPPPPPPPTDRAGNPPAPSSSLPAPARALAISIAVLLVANLLTLVSRLGDDDDYPDEWDPRVADLIDFVEQDRDLRFDHPVPVDFLSPAEYTEAVSGDLGELSEEDRQDFVDQVEILRALGLAEGDIDLADALGQVLDAGTLAFYSPDDERIRVRGTEMTVALRVTLVHELTHALQDQHFDLGNLLFEAEDVGSATARRALGEGDAVRVEEDYVEVELSDDERDEYDEQHQDEIDQSTEGTADVPDALQADFALPYALGHPFLTTLLADDGNDRVDEAFREPPSTVEHLFDPASFLADEGASHPDAELDGDDDAEEIDFGIGSWFLVLGQRIDAAQALDAALGWAGDGAVRFERDERTCVRAVFEGDRDEDEDEMAAAIEAWAAAMPGGLSEPVTVEGQPGFESCDPGAEADLGVEPIAFDLLALPATWGYLVAQGTALGLDPDEARCFAAAVFEGTTLEELTSLEPEVGEAVGERYASRYADARSRCGSGDR